MSDTVLKDSDICPVIFLCMHDLCYSSHFYGQGSTRGSGVLIGLRNRKYGPA